MTDITYSTFKHIAEAGDLARVVARARAAAADAGWTQAERERRQAAEDAARQARSAEAAARERLTRLRRAGVPAKHEKVLIESYDASGFLPARVVARWRPSPHHTLVLGGALGVGKSVAACWLIDQGPRGRYRSPDGYDAATWPDELAPRYVHAGRLARQSMFAKPGHVSELDLLERVSLLIIDEVGGAEAGPAWVARLDTLVSVRADNLLDTVVTTNLKTEEFEAAYGERVLDRMRGDGRCWVECAGKSGRDDQRWWDRVKSEMEVTR